MKRTIENNTNVVIELPEEIWYSIIMENSKYWCLKVAYDVCRSWRQSIRLNLREIVHYHIPLCHIVSKLPNIQVLYRYGEVIESFGSMTTLRTLHLDNVRAVQSYRPVSLAKLSNLTKLTISNTRVTLPIVAPLIKLVVLRDAFIDTRELLHYTQLRKLYIPWHHMNTDVITQLTSLRDLSIDLSRVVGDITSIFTMTQLTYLALQYKPAHSPSHSSILYENLSRLINLDTFVLVPSIIGDMTLNSEFLRPLTRLKELSFQRVRTACYLPPTLESLSINNKSFLHHIPTLPQLTHLEVLDHDVYLSPQVSERLPSLKQFFFYGCNDD